MGSEPARVVTLGLFDHPKVKVWKWAVMRAGATRHMSLVLLDSQQSGSGACPGNFYGWLNGVQEIRAERSIRPHLVLARFNTRHAAEAAIARAAAAWDEETPKLAPVRAELARLEKAREDAQATALLV